MASRIILLSVLICLSPGYVLTSFAQNLNNLSDLLTVRFEDKTVIYDSPTFEFENLVVSSETAELDREKLTITLSGQVKFQTPTVIIHASQAIITLSDEGNLDNLDDLGISFKDVSFYDPAQQFYAKAESVTRISEREYLLKEIYLTHCPPHDEAWSFKIRKIEYELENFLLGYDVWMKVYDVPIAYLSHIIAPTTTKRKSGFLNPSIDRLEQHNATGYGIGLKIPYFFNLAPDHDLTIDYELYSKRGLALGAEYNYAFLPNQRGRAYFWQIYEGFEDRRPAFEYRMEADDDPNPLRARLDFDHRQLLASNQELFINAHYNSDSLVRSDYFGTSTDRKTKRSLNAALAIPGFWSYAYLTGEFRKEYLYDSRYDLQENEAVLNQNSFAYQKIWPLLRDQNLQLTTDFELAKFDRDYGWSGNRTNFQGKLEYFQDAGLLNIDYLLGYNSFYYQTDYHGAVNDRSFASEEKLFYKQFTKSLELSFRLARYDANQEEDKVRKTTIDPYLKLVDRNDADLRKILNRAPSQTLNYNNQDYQDYELKFSKNRRLPARQSLELGTMFATKTKSATKPTQKPSPELKGKAYLLWDLRKPTAENSEDEALTGPRIEEKYRETEPDKRLLPLRFEFEYKPNNSFGISSFLRYSMAEEKNY